MEILRQRGVRLIAINDGVDSARGDDDFTPFRKEIEAKKAAIRAENIAKGVFVPVSSLPQREPIKGVQTA